MQRAERALLNQIAGGILPPMPRSMRPALFSSLIAVVFAVGCDLPVSEEPPVPAIEMMDVTPVWPLPVTSDFDERNYIRARAEGGHGIVLPRDVFDSIPVLTRVDEPDDLYNDLIIVGARLDPCFQEGINLPCEVSVRLVLQPLRPGLDSQAPIEARDASVHAFYVLESEAEILDAIKTLARAREAAGLATNQALSVHPLLETDDGRAAIRDVLLPLIGINRLKRVTSMAVHGGNTAWTFSGFGLDGPLPEPTDVREQHVLSTGDSTTIHVEVDPTLEGEPEDYSLLLDEDRAIAATREERQSAFDAAARVENPLIHSQGTLGCVTCHLPSTARASALRREALDASPDAYLSERHNLSVSPAFADSRIVHNLAYRLDVLALSPRLIHESAMVADRVDVAVHP